jgi:AcrR family transcriptional regulator
VKNSSCRKEGIIMGKVDVNKQQKESSLLKTAFEFFTTKGFSKTSISDIAGKAGVAKGTFYLYFKDKYDIRNKLVAHKSSQIFLNAMEDIGSDINDISFEDKLIRIVDNIINQLDESQSLLTFISKNLSWGVFKSALTSPASDNDVDFSQVYDMMLAEAPYKFRDPEIMLFMIIELVSSTCYSAILYKDPCTLAELKPYLYNTVRLIISQHKIAEQE